jgi:hemerythrin superfamily protein
MSGLDKVIAAITPPESEEMRAEARAKARSVAKPGDWLSQILDHHERIERAFAEVQAATDAQARRAAEKRLGVILTGHAIAEEAVIYPALAHIGKKISANMAYTEQVAAKMQMAALERMDPMSEDYVEKLGHLQGAVAHHVYEEEHGWFVDLKDEAPLEDQDQITQRYSEEFGRYMSGGEATRLGERAPLEPRSFAASPTPPLI